MSQWGQAQPGYQYPTQTGFQGGNPQFQPQNPQFQQQNPQYQQQNPQFQPPNPQQGGFGNVGVMPQQTGFPGQRMQGFQQPQQTGFQGVGGGGGFMQPQPTGFPAQGNNFQQQSRPMPPPVPSLPTQYQQQNQAPGFLGLPQQQQQPQVNRFLSASPGLVPQATGFPGRGGPLVPQMTGYVDPRLQMMSNTFMPMNNGSQFGAGAAPQLAPPQYNLQQSFQQHNQTQRGTPTPQMPWALTKAEKKQYNDIFRSWDAQSTGFINGQTALEVFGASGLPKDDLARIWTLADIDDRGKLNIAEFHVAMGLIYRRLSGMQLPEQLPAELVPPSARDLGNSVDIVKDLLRHESRARSPSSIDTPTSYLKTRSFNNSSSTLDSGRDATIYKHSDSEPPGGFYQPRSRHLNRDDVRSRSEDDSPAADLSDMKRMLANTAKMLDQTAEADASRTAEDEALDREMEDLKYRVKRVSDDLEYVSRGPKTAAKDQERRKLERELLSLMHERVPEVERKIKARDERKEKEKRQWARDRDRANERSGRYDAKDDAYSSSSRQYDDRDRDRPYSRGGYDRGRDDDRDSYRRDRRTPSRDSRDRERPRTPPTTRSPPPPPPAAAPSSSIRDPPPAPQPPKQSSPAPLKNMTPAERQAYLQAEAKRRIEARMAALGVAAPSSSPTIDTSVEDRLQREKKEAEEKTRAAEKQAEERERLRNERLESEKATKAPSPAPPTAAPPAPTPTIKAPTAPAPAPTSRAAPPAPKSRAPAPPPPRKTPAVRQPPVVVTPPAPARRDPTPEPEVDPEEERLRAREEAIRKQREARAEKLRQLEREEEEAARLEEEKYQARLQALKARSAPAPVSPPAPAAPAFTPAPPPPKAATPPPAAPPAPENVVTPAADGGKSTNPFSRLINKGPSAPPPATNGSTNPWARSQTAPPPSAPNAPRSPAPPATKAVYNTAPSSAIDDDWDDIKENDEDDDSSDDEMSGRGRREDIARQLFGSILPTSRPQSAAANTTTKIVSSPSSPAPPTPPAPPAPPMNAQAAAPSAPPPPPQPPVAPAAPAAPMAAAPPGDLGGLMRSIQGGLKLRPAKTVDKSAPPVSGRVLGDTAPPPHINAAPRPASPPRSVTPPPAAELPIPATMSHDEGSSRSDNRQSMGWFADRAADAGVEVQRLPSTNEEEEEEEEYDEGLYESSDTAPIPAIHVNEASQDLVPDLMADINKTIVHRARTLYPYEGEGPDDLSFGENLVLTAHPSKTGGDWWHGTLVSNGKSGVFPKAYVEVIKPIKAKALYTYTGNNPDELPFTEGDEITIIDKSEEEWWKTEQGGVVFIVPAAYLEVVEAAMGQSNITDATPTVSPVELTSAAHLPGTIQTSAHEDLANDGDDDSDSDDSDYLSFDESDVEDGYPETKAEREARAHERQLVLEAAGLIVTQDDKPPPSLIRARSTKRRPAPAAPERTSIIPVPPSKELPPVPAPEPDPEPIDHARRLDDAFDRYESFKNSNGNRMSVASVDTLPPSPSASSFSGTNASPSKDGGESRSYSNFLNFLGRTKTPDGDRRPMNTLTISAPIMNSSDDPSRSNSPAFGTSWASLVDKTALSGIPPGERRRQEAIFELINTEAAYVRDLQLIVEVFYSSMLPLLSQKEVTVVFANVEDILLTNTTLMSSLEERQKDCRLYVDKIGDILLNHLPNMGVYMGYCVNQSTAIKVLKSLRESNPALASHLQRLRDDPVVRNLDLSSYLLVPMQRITKYPLLIKQILHHTEAGDERASIQNALDISEKLLDRINETIRDQEGRETLKVISQNLWIGQGRLDLTAPTRYMGARKLIKEGALMKAKSGRKLYGFLCSDILVLTDESMKTLYRMPIPLAQARVKEVHPGKDDLTFQVTQAYPRGGDAIALKAMSVRDCQVWMHEIEYAGRRCRHAEDRATRKHRK